MAKAAFRPEIEGLRAVAAILVAIFHIWLGRVSGGVDVFFVVSGFLITTSLSGQVERSGRVRFRVFWGRLVKRLVPAALTVLVAVIVASVFLLPKSRWKDNIEAIAAAAVYVENWLLAYKSVDYLAKHAAVSPVQHFWALSTQGQFYLLWPFLFAAGAWAAGRARASLRTVMVPALSVILGLSLAFSIHLTAKNQPFAYFNTFARLWEFCIGALLALLITRIQLPQGARVVCGWVGLLAILCCGLLLHVSSVFPGYAALWPTLAAALIIVAGTSGSRFGADRLLASRPLVAFGGISYGLYLWHFPILVFVRTALEPCPVTGRIGAMILAASFVLAVATNRLIENPARYSGKAEAPSGAFALGGVYSIPVLLGLAGWTGYYLHVRNVERARHIVVGSREYSGAQTLEDGIYDPIAPETVIYPGPFSVSSDRDYVTGPGCDLPDSATQPSLCTVHAPQHIRLNVAIVGGSHSAQWLPGLKEIAARNDWRLITFTKSNCPFYIGESVGDRESASCHEWNENVLKTLLSLKPDVVFTTSTRPQEVGDDVPAGYLRAWEQLTPAAIRVIAIRDNPDFGFDVSACIELHGPESPQCSRPRPEVLSEPNPIQRHVNRLPNVKFIDLSDYFCDRTTCYPTIGNVLVYRHMNHITASYVMTLTPMLERAMTSALDGESR